MKVFSAQLIAVAIVTTVVGMPVDRALSAKEVGTCSHLGVPAHEAGDRDKTGTSPVPQNDEGSQVAENKPDASCGSFKAEGTRLELATGFPAPHFQCGR